MIEGLPAGYDTRLGRLFGGGTEPSEGQWQRIALARALLRPSAVMLLDEPTSALDPRAERQLLDTVVQETRDRILLVVSHRLSTVQAADRILVLSGGRVTESGPHDRLIRAGGGYADLFARCASP